MASRRLRALVARLEGCLPELPQGPARLLGLRAGLIGRPALSAAATARVLRVTLPAEGRLERRAVTALREAGSTGCGAAGSASGSTVGSTLAAGATNQLSPRPASASSPAGAGTARSTRAAHAGASRHGVTRSAGSGTPSAGNSMPTMTAMASTPGWALISALAALALAGGLALLRAYRGPARAEVQATPRSSPAQPIAPTAPPVASAAPPVSPSPLPAAPPTGRVSPPARPPAPTPAGPRRVGRHELEVAAVTLTAIAGGAARLVSLARRRSARRR